MGQDEIRGQIPVYTQEVDNIPNGFLLVLPKCNLNLSFLKHSSDYERKADTLDEIVPGTNGTYRQFIELIDSANEG